MNKHSKISRVLGWGAALAIGTALSGCANSPMQATVAQNQARSDVEYRLLRDNYDSHSQMNQRARYAPPPKGQSYPAPR